MNNESKIVNNENNINTKPQSTELNAKLEHENHWLIDEFDLNLICDFFLRVERQGPGSPEATLKALSFIDNLTDESRIADLGCGTGGQTVVLAQHAPGHITGLDLFPRFIERLNNNAENLNLQDRVKGIVGSMDKLPFQEEEFDLIWSEGAIYNIGFERGLREWRKYLKAGGYVAVTESAFFTDEPPAEVKEFWMEAYPDITTIPNYVARIQKAGYIPVASFILPKDCWTEHYFAPVMKAQPDFMKKYAGNETSAKFAEFQCREEALYRKYNEFYGYVFFIAKKIEQ